MTYKCQQKYSIFIQYNKPKRTFLTCLERWIQLSGILLFVKWRFCRQLIIFFLFVSPSKQKFKHVRNLSGQFNRNEIILSQYIEGFSPLVAKNNKTKFIFCSNIFLYVVILILLYLFVCVSQCTYHIIYHTKYFSYKMKLTIIIFSISCKSTTVISVFIVTFI